VLEKLDLARAQPAHLHGHPAARRIGEVDDGAAQPRGDGKGQQEAEHQAAHHERGADDPALAHRALQLPPVGADGGHPSADRRASIGVVERRALKRVARRDSGIAFLHVLEEVRGRRLADELRRVLGAADDEAAAVEDHRRNAAELRAFVEEIGDRLRLEGGVQHVSGLAVAHDGDVHREDQALRYEPKGEVGIDRQAGRDHRFQRRRVADRRPIGLRRRRIGKGARQRLADRPHRVEDLASVAVEERDEEAAALRDDAPAQRIERIDLAAIDERRLGERIEHRAVGLQVPIDRNRQCLRGL
jgi:hypothetical protein